MEVGLGPGRAATEQAEGWMAMTLEPAPVRYGFGDFLVDVVLARCGATEDWWRSNLRCLTCW